MGAIDKKTIQDYWTKNVPGLDIVCKKYSPQQREFYTEVDQCRFKNEPYIIPLINSFAQKSKVILEIGCGMGSDSRYISKKGSRIISLDLSFDNVSFALKGLQLLKLKGSGVCADAEHLPFKDNMFDVVYSYGVLHHTPDTQGAIREIFRILKSGGKCVIMLYHKGYAYLYINLLYGIKRLFTSEERLTSEHYDFTPLSKMYSKKQARKLFNKFKNTEFFVTTFRFGGVGVDGKLGKLHYLLRNKFLMDRLGQFLIIKAEK